MSLIIKSGTSAAVAEVAGTNELMVRMPTDQVAALVERPELNSAFHPTTGVQTSNNVNNVSPSNASLSNTVPAYNTLGGRFQWVSRVGAATDYALFGYQVPAGFTLNIVSVNISISNLVIKNSSAQYFFFDWALGANGSSASLANAHTPPTSYAPQRVSLGSMSFQSGGQVAMNVYHLQRDFHAPVKVLSERYAHVILQIPHGSAVATQVQRGVCMIDGFFE